VADFSYVTFDYFDTSFLSPSGGDTGGPDGNDPYVARASDSLYVETGYVADGYAGILYSGISDTSSAFTLTATTGQTLEGTTTLVSTATLTVVVQQFHPLLQTQSQDKNLMVVVQHYQVHYHLP
jgi:hypothetical protein